jgi:integrase
MQDDLNRIVDAAQGPFKTCCWIMAETGCRIGEDLGIAVTNLLLDQGKIEITQSVWHGKIQTVKSIKGRRSFDISPQLVEHLRSFLRQWRPNPLGLLFATRNGTPWDQDVVRKRKLYPLLDKLGIPRCGFHAFRHGNETIMDQENVPMRLRQDRLGHSDARTTMLYSHANSEDGKRIAARLGYLLTRPVTTMIAAGNA